MASCRLVPHNTWLKLVGYSSCGEQWISEYKVALRFQSCRGRDPPIPSPRPTILSLPTSSLLRSLIPLCSATSDVSSTSPTDVKSYTVVSCLRHSSCEYIYIYYIYAHIVELSVSLQVFFSFFLFFLSSRISRRCNRGARETSLLTAN